MGALGKPIPGWRFSENSTSLFTCVYRKTGINVLLLHLLFGPGMSDGIFLHFVNFIVQCNIQKYFKFIVSSCRSIWSPADPSNLPFPLFFSLLIGQHVLTHKGPISCSGVRLTPLDVLRMRLHVDEIILKIQSVFMGILFLKNWRLKMCLCESKIILVSVGKA